MNACFYDVDGFLSWILCVDLATNYVFIPAMMIMLGVILIGSFAYFRDIDRALMAGGAIMTMISTIAVMLDMISINWFMFWFIVMIAGVAFTMISKSDG